MYPTRVLERGFSGCREKIWVKKKEEKRARRRKENIVTFLGRRL